MGAQLISLAGLLLALTANAEVGTLSACSAASTGQAGGSLSVGPLPLDGNPVVQPITIAVDASAETAQSITAAVVDNQIAVTMEASPDTTGQHACGKVRMQFLPAGTYAIKFLVHQQGGGQSPSAALASVVVEAPPVAPAGLPASYSFAETASIGEIAFTHSVSADGAALIHVPIDAPVGRQGLGPAMGLDYSSRDGNGPLGVGWRLSGLSSITACRGVPAIDGSYAGQYPNRLCLDGERLVPAILGLDGNRLTAVSGTEYRSERNPFSRVVAHGTADSFDSFEVFTPDGKTYRYASRVGSHARLEGNVVSCIWGKIVNGLWSDAFGGCENGAVQRRAWQLDEVQDLFGNRMEIDYDATEPLLVSEVRYTYHLRAGVKFVELGDGYRANTKKLVFEYESREDSRSFSLDGIDYSTQKRLKTVKVIGPLSLSHQNYAKQNGILWQYSLSYLINPVTQQSTLQEVVQCAGDTALAACKSPLKFSYTGTETAYTDTALPFVLPHGQTSQSDFGVDGFRIADVNGDGLDDVLYRTSNKVVPIPMWKYRLSDGQQLGAEQATNLPGVADTAEYGIGFADLDRNDTVDALIPTAIDGYGALSYSIAQGSATGAMQSSVLPTSSYWLPTWKYAPRGDGSIVPDNGGDDRIAGIADLDGDGLPDLILRYGGVPAYQRWGYARNISDQTTIAYDAAEDFITTGTSCIRVDNNPYSGNNFSNCFNTGEHDPAFVVDIDGNGTNEIIVARGVRFTDPGQARQHFYNPELVALSVFAPVERRTGLSSKEMPRVFLDVNGDGLPDAVHVENNHVFVALNRGGSYGAPQQLSLSAAVVDALSQPNEMRIGDFNNDGLEDIYEVSTGILLLANGQGGFTQTTLPFPVGEDTCNAPNCPSFARRGWDQILDFNGDGLMDFLQMRSDGPHLMVRTGPAPALLEQVSGGPMTPDVHFAYQAAPQVHSPGTCTYPQRCLKKGAWLVAEMGERSDLSSTPYPNGFNRKTYSYSGGRFDERGRGWLGFEHTTVVDMQTGAKTTTDFDNVTSLKAASGYYNYPGAMRASRVTAEVDTRLAGESSGHIRRSTTSYQYQDTLVPGSCPCAIASQPSLTWHTDEEASARDATVSSFVPIKSSVSKYIFDPYGLMIDDFEQSFEGGVANDGSPPPGAKVKSLEIVRIPPPTIDTAHWLIRRYSTAWEKSTEPARDAVAASENGPAMPAQAVQVTSRAVEIGWQPGTMAINRIKAQPSVLDPSLNSDTVITRDPTGNIASITRTADSGNGVTSRVVSINWDSLDKTYPYQITNPAEHAHLTYFQAGLGQEAVSIDVNGLSTVTSFDQFGRVRQVHAPSAADTLIDYLQLPAGLLVTTQAADGAVHARQIDKWGQTIRTEGSRLKGSTAVVDTTYTRSHQLSTRTVPHYGAPSTATLPTVISELPAHVAFAYDSLGRLRSRTVFDGHRVLEANEPSERETWTYSGLVQDHIDMRGIRSSFETDSSSRVIRATTFEPLPVLHAVLEPNHKVEITPQHQVVARYEYAPFNLLQAITDPAGNRLVNGYDDLGRLVDVQSPSTGHSTAQYNGYGETVFLTDGAGDQISIQRDALGRIGFNGYSDPSRGTSASETFEWDTALHGVGKLASATSTDEIKTAYEYDALSRLSKKAWTVSGESFALETVWDNFDRPQFVKYPAVGAAQLSLEYDYEPGGTLIAIKDQQTQVPYWTLLSQDATGVALSEQFGDAFLTQRVLDTRARLKAITTSAKSAGAPSSTLQSISYDYGSASLLRDRSTAVSATAQASELFDYDYLGRLSAWTVVQSGNTSEQMYRYDDLGNLISLSVAAGSGRTATALYGPTPSSPNAGPYAIRELDESSKKSLYFYDAAGRQTDGPGRTIGWNDYNLPASIIAVQSLSEEIDLRYDAEHRRTVKVGPSEIVTTVGGAYERHTDGSVFRHVFNLLGPAGVFGQITWTQSNGVPTPADINFLHADALGTPETVTDQATQGISEKVEYEPFGQRRTPTALADPMMLNSVRSVGFTGQRPDDEFHLIDMRGRLYDPQTTRFLSADPLIGAPLSSQGLNSYAYVANNPLNFVDPSGFQADGLGISWEYDEIGGTNGPIGWGGDWEWQCCSPPSSGGYGSSPSQRPAATRPTTGGDQTRPMVDAGPGWAGSVVGVSMITPTEGMGNNVALDLSTHSASLTNSDPDLQASLEWLKSFVQRNKENLNGFSYEERNWAKLLIGEDGGLSWMHGGEFLTGTALMSFTTFSVPFAAAGGVIADTATLPLKGMDTVPLCITCKVLGEGYVTAYAQEYEEFIEPSAPGQLIFNPISEWLESKGAFPNPSTWPSPFEIFDWSGSHYHTPQPPLDPESWLKPRQLPPLPEWKF